MNDNVSADGGTLDFQLTRQDFTQYQRLLGTAYRLRIVAVYVTAFVIAGFLLKAIFNILSRTAPYVHEIWGMDALIAIVLFFSVAFIVFRIFSASLVYVPDSFTCAVRFRLTETGITSESDYLQSLVRWRGIVEIRETKAYLLFFLDRMQAFMVPKRAFPDAAAIAAFLTQARQYWRDANPQN